MVRRTLTTSIGDISAPVIFPSISSLRAYAPVPALLNILDLAESDTALISAADVFGLSSAEREEVRSWCEQSAREGRAVLLDSGGYEAWWKGWSHWSQETLAEVSGLEVAIRFALDARWDSAATPDQIIRVATEAVERLIPFGGVVAPVVRAPSNVLASVVVGTIESTDCAMIAVAERDLGWGVLDRYSTLFELRKDLDSIRENVFLHVLGAGSPHDVLLYWLAGADSFDGLEWCMAAIDPGTRSMFGLSRWQILAPTSIIGAEAERLPYFESMALSNLFELKGWMSQLRAASREEAIDLAAKVLDTAVVQHIRSVEAK